MTPEEHLDKLMDWFNFRDVARTMKFLKWEWDMGAAAHVPDEPEIRQYVRTHAKRVLQQALTDTGHAPGKGFHGSGGFHIEAIAENGEIRTLYCRFTLTEWNTD